MYIDFCGRVRKRLKPKYIDEPAETGELRRYREPENHSFADTGPSKGMHIELRAEGISQSNYSRLSWLDCQDYTFRKCPS